MSTQPRGQNVNKLFQFFLQLVVLIKLLKEGGGVKSQSLVTSG
jgi:hypothetical protein